MTKGDQKSIVFADSTTKRAFSPLERRILERLTERLSSLPALQSILVFGSRARSRSTEDSDLDVAVIVDAVDRPITDAVEEAKWCSIPPESFLNVNMVILSRKQLASGGRFARVLRSEGVSLWTRKEEKR